GFQFYAERAGMRPVIPRYSRPVTSSVELPPPSELRKDDWLVVPDSRLNQQGIDLDDPRLELVETLHVGGTVPLRTVPCFYGGRTALEHNEGSGLDVRLYRVRSDFVPSPGKGWKVPGPEPVEKAPPTRPGVNAGPTPRIPPVWARRERQVAG